MDLMEAIKGRRSIRKYKPDPVPEEALRTVMEAVRWAPSWANTQCWEVIVIKDPKVKSELATVLSKGNPALSSLTDAPLVLVLCGKKGISGFYKGQSDTDKGDWLMFDTGSCHADSLFGCLRSRLGHGRCWECSIIERRRRSWGFPEMSRWWR